MVSGEAHAAVRVLARGRGVNQLTAKLDAELTMLDANKTIDLPAFNKLVREPKVPEIMGSMKGNEATR